MTECGTYAAVNVHKKAGEPLDPACLAADAEYAAAWRLRNAASRRLTVRRQAAAVRVQRAMAEAYPVEAGRAALYERGQDPGASTRTIRDRAARRLAKVSRPTEYARRLEVEFAAAGLNS